VSDGTPSSCRGGGKGGDDEKGGEAFHEGKSRGIRACRLA
jgi:hypothetical protein